MNSVTFMPILGIVAVTLITVLGCVWIMNMRNK
jgi:hypothetical protein